MPKTKPAQTKSTIGWTQTDRSAHKIWADLAVQNPRASALMHMLAAESDPRGEVVMSHTEMKILMGVGSVTTIKTALKTLSAWNFIRIKSNAKLGDVNRYELNNHVVWASKREHLKFGAFKAELGPPHARQRSEPPSRRKSLCGLPYRNAAESIDSETGEITTLADPRDLRDAA